MQQVSVNDATTHLSALLARVEAGDEIVIARANQPVARLVPYRVAQPRRRLGEAKGLVTMADDFDELPGDFMAHFR